MDSEYSFQDLINMSRKVIAAFDRAEQRPWTIEVTMVELMKQVGDLAKHVMVKEQYYLPDRDNHPNYKTEIADIADELADILHGVIRIAEHYQIDLEAAHTQTRRDEMKYVGEESDF